MCRPFAMLLTMSLCAAGANATAQGLARDYPQWRGRDRDGSASAFTPPRSWPDQLRQRWKVTLGEGYATPLLVNERGFTLTRLDSHEVVTALEAGTGKVIWQNRYPVPHRIAGGAAGHGQGPKSTPLVHAGRLFTLGITGVVSAFDAADGKLLWQRSFENKFYNNSITPIIVRDMILVSAYEQGVLGFSPVRRNGMWELDTRWHTKDVSLFMSNPVLVGDTLYGLSQRSSGQFFALDAPTGNVLWLGTPREATNTAIVKAGDLLFLLNDDGELIVARANRDKFEPLKRYTVADSSTWASPSSQAIGSS